jgi:hypothetical protein
MTGLSSRFILYKETEDEENNRPTIYEGNNYHDMINAMLHDDEFMELQDPEVASAIQVARDVLCWTLGHDHNTNLAENLHLWSEAYSAHCGTTDSYDN